MSKGKGSASTDAVEAEVTPESTLTFTWAGNDYEIPGSLDDCDIEAFEALRRGDDIGYIVYVLGQKQWRDLKAASKLKARDRRKIADGISKVFGLGTTGE